jgi:hypothetical protein
MKNIDINDISKKEFLKEFKKCHRSIGNQLKELYQVDYINYINKLNNVEITEFNILLDNIRNYNIEDNFLIDEFIIHPDINFFKLIKKYEDFFDINEDYKFCFFVNYELDNNLIIIKFPLRLNFLKIKRKCINLILRKNKYLTTNSFYELNNYSIWFNLVSNTNFYAFTSQNKTGIISKELSNEKIKEILDNIIKNEDLIFDNDLKKKIEEIYGYIFI